MKDFKSKTNNIDLRKSQLALSDRKDRCLAALVAWREKMADPPLIEWRRQEIESYMELSNIIAEARSVLGMDLDAETKRTIDEALKQNGGEG